MSVMDLISAQLAKPITHNVITAYADGTSKTHGCRSAGGAENFATAERRKIGLTLFTDRTRTKTVRVVSITIERI